MKPVKERTNPLPPTNLQIIKIFKGCFPQILLSPFLITLSYILQFLFDYHKVIM